VATLHLMVELPCSGKTRLARRLEVERSALRLVPLLTYYNTGSWQFGYRFSLDFIIPVMMVLAIGAGTKVSRVMKALIILSVAINAIGVA
jgi:hypothetical protein